MDCDFLNDNCVEEEKELDVEDLEQFVSSLDGLQFRREPVIRTFRGKKINEQDIDRVIYLGETLIMMRMTIQNLIRSLTTVFPVDLSLLLKKISSTTCLEYLEDLFNEKEGVVDLPDCGEGDLAELLETFPRMSVEDDRVE